MKCIGVSIPASVMQKDLHAKTYIEAVNFADKVGLRLQTPEDFETAHELFALYRNQQVYAQRLAMLKGKFDEAQRLHDRADKMLQDCLQRLLEQQLRRR